MGEFRVKQCIFDFIAYFKFFENFARKFPAKNFLQNRIFAEIGRQKLGQF